MHYHNKKKLFNKNICQKQMKKKELYVKPVAKKMTLEVSSLILVGSTWTNDNFSKKESFEDEDEEQW